MQKKIRPFLFLFFFVNVLLIIFYTTPPQSSQAQSISSPTPTISLKSGDVNNDGSIDLTDLRLIMQNWLQQLTNTLDVFGDGRINAMDFARVIQQMGTTPTNPVTPTPIASSQNSAAFGIWEPNPKFDTCPSYPVGVTTDQQKIDYIKSIHNSYKVQGPDGKWYPTWHPPVDPATGCKFGHEHGLDPSKSLVWDQVRNYFAYDANKNGIIDSNELAAAGIPFGYVNEQMDMSPTFGFMRHEDHVGHKVNYANGEPDIATDQFDTNPTGGVVVPIKDPSGTTKWLNSGVRCYYLAKVHQGVSTNDAFTNNLHEVMYFSDCKGQNGTYDMQSSVAVMMKFGKVGEFTNLCDGDGDRTTPVVIGTTAANQNYPGTRGNGDRSINQRSCIEKYFLVPQGTFSMNMYEAWPGTIRVTTPAGKDLLTGANMLFDVEDANRYYYPGKTHPETGTTKYDNAGFSMDLCYETLTGGRQARGGMCDYATNYGSIKGITWDDPRSAFRGLHRGMYFMPSDVNNSGGPQYWYTDVFGGNAQQVPFPGSVRQYMSSKIVRFGNLGALDPRVSDREFPDGNRTVHAPN